MAVLPKKIRVVGVPATWPRSRMPNFYPTIPRTYEVDMAQVLLMIGRVTTPPLSSGASLAEFWACVRYMFAWRPSQWLSLTDEFGDLDPHQKTILSDDLGMGIPLYWLTNRLRLNSYCDGRYFVERFLSTYGGTYTGKAAKKGPGKAPDFVCYSNSGKFHIVECKGTQTSTGYRDDQLGLPIRKGIFGGRAQKRTITFPARYAGERLACGTFISSNDEQVSSLKIVDPEDPPLVEINEENAAFAVDPIARATMAQMLRAAGFPFAANVTAFPQGRVLRIEDERFVFPPIEERAARFEAARDELGQVGSYQDLTSDNGRFVGRRSMIELPKTLIVNDRPVTKIEISQGVDPDLLKDGGRALLEERIVQRKEDPGILKVAKFESDENEASMTIGTAFRSELRLLA